MAGLFCFQMSGNYRFLLVSPVKIVTGMEENRKKKVAVLSPVKGASREKTVKSVGLNAFFFFIGKELGTTSFRY